MMELIADNLDLKVDGRTLIQKLDWTVKTGQCWFVYGRNGAGKTTLLQTLAGLRLPDGGQIMLDGQVLSCWPIRDLAKKRAYLPQSQQDAFGFTVFETVLAARFPWHLTRWASFEDTDVVINALKYMDVFHLADRDVRTLSGGERQRVAIATLLTQDTPLMLLDEPATALDLAYQARLIGLITQFNGDGNRVIVNVVHDLNLAWGIATHILLLYGDGQWESGRCEDMMIPEKLSHCLRYPVEKMMYGSRPVFMSF